MRILRLVIVGLAALFVGARYARERSRLRTVARLGGLEGQRYLESTRARSDGAMVVTTVLLAAAAAASVVYTVLTG